MLIYDPRTIRRSWLLAVAILALPGCGQDQAPASTETVAPAEPVAIQLDDADVEKLVRASYRFVAMYNVNNKMAVNPQNPLATGGWNRVRANPKLTDHTMKAIARPNNDTLYTTAVLDLTKEPMIVQAPAFDSVYVSMMANAYDHHVNIPMSTRLGDFSEPSTVLFYSARTPGYAGEAVDGVDKIVEMDGDFVSVVFRVMPHANEPDRLQRNLDAMQQIRVTSLFDFLSGATFEPGPDAAMPPFGQTDFDIFENNLLEVMQFIFNHTTFHPDDPVDREVLAIYEPLGVVPGREYDPDKVAKIDGERVREVAERVAREELAKATDPEFMAQNVTALFKTKGQISAQRLLFQSVLGPIGQPAEEAVYPSIATADGSPMNAMHDYVIRMSADELPPANAFWSLTLYDSANGFFMPNDRKKYSVGENAGFRLDDEGGIAIYVSAEQPPGVPGENWLPVVRGDYDMDVILRVYAPDLERFANWTAPKAERID